MTLSLKSNFGDCSWNFARRSTSPALYVYSLRFTYYVSLTNLRTLRAVPSIEPAPSKNRDKDDPLTARELLRGVEDNAETLARKLSAFESAWHVVGNACSQLSADLELAKSFTAVSTTSHARVESSVLIHVFRAPRRCRTRRIGVYGRRRWCTTRLRSA